MVIPMVGLVILDMFISNSASDVKKTGTGSISSGGDRVVNFSILHFLRSEERRVGKELLYK